MNDGPFLILYVPKKVKDTGKKIPSQGVLFCFVFIKTYGDRQVCTGAMGATGRDSRFLDQKGVPAGLAASIFPL